MRRAQQLHRHAGVARLLLEAAHRAHRALAQIAGVGLIEGIAQPGEQLQQRRRGGDQRIERRSPIVFAAVGRRGGARRRHRGASSEPRALPARAARRRPPGIGRMTVRSPSSGSENGLSLIAAPAAADRPQLQSQVGKIPRNVDGEAAGVLHLLPVRAVAVELEIGRAGVERDLPRRHRQRAHRDARAARR